MPTLPRRELTCTHLRSSQTASSPVSQCISINQALACPPPSPAAGFGGVTCDPWQMVRGLPPLPQELLQPAICQAAQISPVLPGSCRAASSPWDPGCCPLCLYRGYRQDLGGVWGASNSPELVAVLPAAYPNHA